MLDNKDLDIVQSLYYNQTARMSVVGEVSEFFNIEKGVRQGCVLSPDLFNLKKGTETLHSKIK